MAIGERIAERFVEEGATVIWPVAARPVMV
jgi:hypothetical protein